VSIDENKELIRKFNRDMNSRDTKIVDKYYSTRAIDHAGCDDREGLKKALKKFFKIYPETMFNIEEMIAERDLVAVRTTVDVADKRGNGKSLSTIEIYRIDDEQIIEHWGYGTPFF